jgi:hypothetical protein
MTILSSHFLHSYRVAEKSDTLRFPIMHLLLWHQHVPHSRLPFIRRTSNHAHVLHAYVDLLLRLLQNGHTLLWNATPEGFMAILHESFHPVGDACVQLYRGRREQLVQDRQEMVQ